MEKVILSAIFVFISSFAFSQDIIVVVAPFELRAGFSKSDAETIEELFLTELAKSKAIKVVDQSDAMFQEILRRMKFELSDWSDDKKVAEFGKARNANAVVLGRMMMLGNQRIITARILDVQTTQILATSRMDMQNVSEVLDKLPAFTTEIINNLAVKPATQPVTPVYKIGDRGPAGGHIFYDKGIFSNGWRYLEAAPVETEFRAQWGSIEEDKRGNYFRVVIGTGTAVGNGKRNTQIIVDRLKQWRESGCAAQLCANLNFDGYRDWFLPSSDELNLMYQNLKQKGLGNFSNSWYWSSSQDDTYYETAWHQRFSDSNRSDYRSSIKDNTHSVRAIRAF